VVDAKSGTARPAKEAWRNGEHQPNLGIAEANRLTPGSGQKIQNVIHRADSFLDDFGNCIVAIASGLVCNVLA
jgi:hypothetical protein